MNTPFVGTMLTCRFFVAFGLLVSMIPARPASCFPAELAAAAERLHYTALRSFKTVAPAMRGKTFAYGYLPGKKKDSAVFWAYKDSRVAVDPRISRRKELVRRYALVVFCKKGGCPDCPMVIPGGSLGPITFEDGLKDLDLFWPVSEHKIKIPKGLVASGRFIAAGDTSADIIYCCYHGTWWGLMRH